MPAGNYKKPPITEAVIAIQFAEPLSVETMERARTKFAKFPSVENRISVSVEIGPTIGASRVAESLEGYKLASLDQTDIVLLDSRNITTSRLAPYNGWERFRNEALENWRLYRETVGYRRVTRIATRYINRLDIPLNNDAIDTSQYINAGPHLPASLAEKVGAFNVVTTLTWPDPIVRVNLIASTLPPHIIKHASLAIDIDVYKDSDVPQKEEEIWSLIDQLRDVKNIIFERCITDAARTIFDAE